jgi:integrase
LSGLRPDDRALVDEWAATLTKTGMAPSAVARLAKRVRGFAEVAQHGLLEARKEDIAALAALIAARLHDGHIDPLKATLRGRSLRETVKALKGFFAWAAERRLVDPSRTPVAGLRLPMPRPHPGIRRLGRRALPYDRLLHVDGPPHYCAIVWLLAFGLDWKEITGLMPADVDLEARQVRLPTRTMPLTAAAAAALAPWVEDRQRHHATSFLFPGRRGRRATRFLCQDAVRRLAEQAGIRRVNMTGYRQLFLARCLRRGIAIDCVPDLLGIPLHPRLRPHVSIPTRERLHTELYRLARRWRRWVG